MDKKLPDKSRIWSKMKDIYDEVLKRGKNSLPHVARLCLIATYIDDGLRMWFDWDAQTSYMMHTWNCGVVIANIFVIVNLIGQLTGATLVIARRFATPACGTLLGITVLQILAYASLWDVRFFLRNLAVIGGMILLLADSRSEGRRLFAGLPSAEDKSRKPYVLLSGRILLVLMFLTLLTSNTDAVSIIETIVGVLLVISIAVGFKTKAASLILAAWLTAINVYSNSWWMVPSQSVSRRDYLKYDFFQTLSVIGGLLLVSALGPGGFSVDKHLKQW